MGSVKGSQDEYRTPYLILFNGMSEARIALERGEYQRAKELLRRASRETDAPALQRQVDRMAVQQDLRRLSWERDFDDCAAHLQRMMTLLRDFLALPRESQQLQLDTFRDAGIEEISQAENFLSRQRG